MDSPLRLGSGADKEGDFGPPVDLGSLRSELWSFSLTVGMQTGHPSNQRQELSVVFGKLLE